MTIEIKRNALTIEADNIKIEETVFEPIYGLKEDGKKDFTNRLGEDVTDEVLNLLSRPLEDLIYYRKAAYDSSGLVLQLFEKLSQEVQQAILSQLNSDYGL